MICSPGLKIIRTPIKPKIILIDRPLVSRSFKMIIAKIAVQIGAVNSMAKTSAKGSRATPYNQPVCPPK